MYIEDSYFENISVSSDIFINIVSMQEMNYESISAYFKAFRGRKDRTWFYCCNRISKKLPDGAIINFSDYGWLSNDKIIIDDLCPWHQKYPINYPLFFKKFDGPIKHRLIQVY